MCLVSSLYMYHDVTACDIHRAQPIQLLLSWLSSPLDPIVQSGLHNTGLHNERGSGLSQWKELVHHSERDSGLSQWKGQLSVTVKGAVVCHSERDSGLSQWKGQWSVTVKGAVRRSSERDGGLSQSKGLVCHSQRG